MRGQAVTHPLRMGESPSHLAPNKHIMSPCLYIRPVRKCESQTPQYTEWTRGKECQSIRLIQNGSREGAKLADGKCQYNPPSFSF